MGKKSVSGSGMNSRIIFPRAWKQFFGIKILKFFDGKIRIRDLGWKKFGSGMFIPDPQYFPGSGTPISRPLNNSL
jgi:hypothetical protein